MVIERDGDAGTQAMDKQVMLVDVSGATDVSSVESLPRNGLPDGLKAVAKRPLIDLLEPRFKIAGDGLPEKSGTRLGTNPPRWPSRIARSDR